MRGALLAGGFRYKVTFTWWPRPLMKHHTDREGFDQVGWVWRQKAFLVKNISHGWIAFVDHQTEEKLKSCPMCERPLNKVEIDAKCSGTGTSA